MNSKLRKMLISSIPYGIIALFATKLGQMWRYTSGDELGEKILNLGDGFFTAMESPMPWPPFSEFLETSVRKKRSNTYGKSDFIISFSVVLKTERIACFFDFVRLRVTIPPSGVYLTAF